MTASAPSDLAVAFRSFGRRLREATDDVAADKDRYRHAQGVTAEVYRLLAEVAPQLHVTPTGDVGTLGSALADAIQAVPADAWDKLTLDELRQAALEAGHLLRSIDLE